MATHKIQKRNGAIVDFDSTKIEKAIFAAAKAAGGKDLDEAKKLVAQVIAELEREDTVPTVEEVQDIVEKVLIKAGHPTTAKVFILYREKRAEQRADRDVVVEVEKTMDEYLNRLDWRVNANSNQGYSLGGMILNTAGKVTANYWLSHIYPKNVGDAHRNGDYHIHDLDMFSGYCAGWSLRALLEEGFNGLLGKTESRPPKHLSSAVSQMVNFLGSLQNEWAGAQAFSSFDTYLAPFVKKYSLETEDSLEKTGAQFETPEARQSYIDRKTYDYVYQNIQSFVFNLNVPSRWGTQTPFTNITLDWSCPEDLQEKRLLLGGEPFEYKFSDNITPDFDWEGENTDLLFEMTAKYGMPYFQNFINSDLKPNHVRSMCCRLQLDLNELLKRGNGLFGSAEMTGSIGVVTINSARVGYTSKGDKQKLLDRVGHLMELAKTSLEIKRKEIQKWIDRGLFPFTKRYLGRLDNHFSTIGINGVNECVRNFSDDKFDIASKEGRQLALEILEFMRTKLAEFQNETGNLYNLEATPAEGTTYRFAKEDNRRFPDIVQAGTVETPYYTNSSQLPVEYTDDAFEALAHQDDLQKMYTGGTVLHLYMGERISDSQACKNLVRKALTNFRLPYITITPTFSICPKHGYLAGEHDFCPLCDEEIGYEGMDHDEKMRAPYVSEVARQQVANKG